MEFKQRTVIATWLLELKLNTLEDAQLQAKLKNDQVLLQKVNQLEKEFFLFIENERKNLNEESIFQILQSHGRMNDYCLKLAKTFKNYETALVVHSINRQEYEDALQTIKLLKDDNLRSQLTLRYGSILISNNPIEFLQLLQMKEYKQIEKRKLVPVLLQVPKYALE